MQSSTKTSDVTSRIRMDSSMCCQFLFIQNEFYTFAVDCFLINLALAKLYMAVCRINAAWLVGELVGTIISNDCASAGARQFRRGLAVQFKRSAEGLL